MSRSSNRDVEGGLSSKGLLARMCACRWTWAAAAAGRPGRAPRLPPTTAAAAAQRRRVRKLSCSPTPTLSISQRRALSSFFASYPNLDI